MFYDQLYSGLDDYHDHYLVNREQYLGQPTYIIDGWYYKCLEHALEGAEVVEQFDRFQMCGCDHEDGCVPNILNALFNYFDMVKKFNELVHQINDVLMRQYQLLDDAVSLIDVLLVMFSAPENGFEDEMIYSLIADEDTIWFQDEDEIDLIQDLMNMEIAEGSLPEPDVAEIGLQIMTDIGNDFEDFYEDAETDEMEPEEDDTLDDSMNLSSYLDLYTGNNHTLYRGDEGEARVNPTMSRDFHNFMSGYLENRFANYERMRPRKSYRAIYNPEEEIEFTEEEKEKIKSFTNKFQILEFIYSKCDELGALEEVDSKTFTVRSPDSVSELSDDSDHDGPPTFDEGDSEENAMPAIRTVSDVITADSMEANAASFNEFNEVKVKIPGGKYLSFNPDDYCNDSHSDSDGDGDFY